MAYSAEVRSGVRPIESGAAYQSLFPTPDRQDRIVLEDGEVGDTVKLMTGVVWKYLDDTSRLAPLLRKKSLESTCRAVWDFVYRHIQYKLDKKGVEQLRRPAQFPGDALLAGSLAACVCGGTQRSQRTIHH
jgi:hypothetical protein